MEYLLSTHLNKLSFCVDHFALSAQNMPSLSFFSFIIYPRVVERRWTHRVMHIQMYLWRFPLFVG